MCLFKSGRQAFLLSIKPGNPDVASLIRSCIEL